MKNFIDQMGNKIVFESFPKRIISIVPSQTELLFYLGLDEEIVGVTKYCIHPKEKSKSKIKVGGTKKLNLEKINLLQPDLIIGNKEENEEGQIRKLMKKYPVWMSDVRNLKDALQMIDSIGDLVGKKEQAKKLSNEIQKQFDNSALNIPKSAFRKCAYFIWRKPWMVAGGDTFINDMLMRCRFENAFSQNTERYPKISLENLRSMNPEIILLSSEPYPFEEKHIAEIKEILPETKVLLADGEMFSWYGSRLLNSPFYFRDLISQILS